MYLSAGNDIPSKPMYYQSNETWYYRHYTLALLVQLKGIVSNASKPLFTSVQLGYRNYRRSIVNEV